MRKHIGAWNCIHITPGSLLRNQPSICCLDASMWRTGAWYSQPNMKRWLSNTAPSTATWLYCPASFSNVHPCMSYLPQARKRSTLSRHFLTQIKCNLPQHQIKLRDWLGSTIKYIFESQTLRQAKNDLWDGRSLIWRKRYNARWYNVSAVSCQQEWTVICRPFAVLCFQYVLATSKIWIQACLYTLIGLTDGSHKIPPTTLARSTSGANFIYAINMLITCAFSLQVLLCEKPGPRMSASMWSEKAHCQRGWRQPTAYHLMWFRTRLSGN